MLLENQVNHVTNGTADIQVESDITMKITASTISKIARTDFLDITIGHPLHSIAYEAMVYDLMKKFSLHQYQLGYWDSVTLSNGGFYMCLRSDESYVISTEQTSSECSSETASIIVNLFALEWLKNIDRITEKERTHFTHLYQCLKDYAVKHIDHMIIESLID